MITILLDLDDTLLDTNIDSFIPAYFSALSKALADIVAPEIMLPALVKGTRAMMVNEDPGLTLQQVFDEHFFPSLGMDRANLQGRIDQFYDEEFPSLKTVVRQRPEAIRFVEWAFASGHRVAIATNPFFPLKAVQHRLRWAGLFPEHYPFSLVSSYETFHFTKEVVSYYPEFLARMGWPEDAIIMVGNDLQSDLLPAMKAGLKVFWLREGGDDVQDGIPQGGFSDLQAWLSSEDPAKLHPGFTTQDSIFHLLRSTPSALSTLTSSLKIADWEHTSVPGEWNLTEILCHLRDVDREINLPRIRKILKDDNPFLVGVASDEWAKERNYRAEIGENTLGEFIEARKELLDCLPPDPAAWLKPARHAIFGPTTLLELTGFMASHDQAHIRQVWKSLPVSNRSS